jgi:hypothetical protein
MVFSFWKKLASKNDDYLQGYIDGFEEGLREGLNHTKEPCKSVTSSKTWEEVYTNSSY